VEVFNLETSTGTYFANNQLVHNCHFAYTHTRGPLAGRQQRPAGALDAGDLMPLALATSILDQLAAAGVRSVVWTGGGEPTLHPQFDAIVRYAEGLGIEQGLYTHGGHIGPERAALLKRALTWVYVSLDAADAGFYKRDKGVDGFEAVCEGVRNLVAAEDSATVGLGFLLTRHNVDCIWRMVALGHELGVDYVQFRPTIRYRADAPNQPDEDTGWVRHAMRWLRSYAEDPFVVADLSRFAMYADWQGHGYPTCYWAALQTVITPNGRVWACCNKREHPDALLGDLSQESFADVWARARPVVVGPQCRVMCRGHVANLTLAHVMHEGAHRNFI
jgi:MoaA/NifB/PqqE/SkfB family radical SAM enzyme